MLDRWGEQDFGRSYSERDLEDQSPLKTRLQEELRRNTHEESRGTVRISTLRAKPPPARTPQLRRIGRHSR